MKTQTEDSREGLHTQGEEILHLEYTDFKVSENSYRKTIVFCKGERRIFSLSANKLNSPIEQETIDLAELIVKAVNERQRLLHDYDRMIETGEELAATNQKLLDSNRELLEVLVNINEWRKLKNGLFTYTNGYGDDFDQKLKTAISNSKDNLA